MNTLITQRVKFKHKLKEIISRNDALPRESWVKVDDHTIVLKAPEDSYEDWRNTFADDIEKVIKELAIENNLVE